jgi:hypothetical protein
LQIIKCDKCGWDVFKCEYVCSTEGTVKVGTFTRPVYENEVRSDLLSPDCWVCTRCGTEVSDEQYDALDELLDRGDDVT